jgi:hypothetical protein
MLEKLILQSRYGSEFHTVCKVVGFSRRYDRNEVAAIGALRSLRLNVIWRYPALACVVALPK